MIVDEHGRRFRNLRLSLTAACNYACTYCVPDGKKLQAADRELSEADLIRAVHLLMRVAGIEKVHLTGGEPLLSPKFDATLADLMHLQLRDVAVTTNGQFLVRKAKTIINSGLTRMNISLDTLDGSRFRELARSGDLKTVLEGIDLMLAAGLKIKINMVPLRRGNIDQILPMLNFALERGIELRYIELMNMGHLKNSGAYQQDFVGMEEILALIGEKYEYARTEAPFDSTAVRFEIPNKGVFGIIANESEPFCTSCTRLRLSSNGYLYGCLSNANRHDLTEVLGLEEPVATETLTNLLHSALQSKQAVSFSGEVTVMKFIGG